MGAIHQALLSIAPPPGGGFGGPEIEFVTALTIGSTRNNQDIMAGFRFTVGASPIQITQLARWRHSGNSQSHSVRIYRNEIAFPLIASVSVDMSSGTVGAFKYAAITPVVLSAGTGYYLVSVEFNGGDIWADDNVTGISTTADATIEGSAYSLDTVNPNFQQNNAGLKSYGAVNFKYQV